MAGCPRALCPQLCPSHPGLGSLSAGEPGPEQPHRVGWGESRGREWTVGQHSKKGRGRRGWWLLPTGTGHGWAVAAVRKTPTLRQQEPPGVNMQTTHKICKHHRELGPRCLALGIRVKAQSSRGRRSLSWAESSLAGLGSPVYRDRIKDRLWGPSADKYSRLLRSGHSCVGEETYASVRQYAPHTSPLPCSQRSLHTGQALSPAALWLPQTPGSRGQALGSSESAYACMGSIGVLS